MEKIELLISCVKMLLISFFIYLIYEKITNKKNSNINYFITFYVSIVISIMYAIFTKYVPSFILIIILYTIYGIIINKIIGNKFSYPAYIYSYVISYVLYLLSVILSGLILSTLLSKMKYTSLINLLTIPVLNTLLFIAVFKINRVKNGFNFLKGKTINNKMKILTLLITGFIILIFGVMKKNSNLILRSCIYVGAIFIIGSIFIWIKSQITKTYKSRMRDRTIEMQKAEIDEKARIMEELKAENIKLASAVHKYNKKFSALEFAMKNALETGVNTEFANELSVILKETKDASKNFAKEVEIKSNKLPLTNNVGIDNMFKYMREEARKKDINFDFKLNTRINPLLENAISKDKFETLIGDHLKDAIIAVNASENSYKSILVTLGIIDGVYEFSIYDTGIEFEIETLLKLGQEQVTTHKEEGGSGIGFMTTFQTLKECKASLIIEEYNPETTNYTKAVIIRFDGKNKYKICSYRAEKIKEHKQKRRIIIEKLK